MFTEIDSIQCLFSANSSISCISNIGLRNCYLIIINCFVHIVLLTQVHRTQQFDSLKAHEWIKNGKQTRQVFLHDHMINNLEDKKHIWQI